MNESDQPPAELEAKVLATLQDRGLVRRSTLRGPVIQVLAVAAAVLLAFFLGRQSGQAPRAATHMILLDGGANMDRSPKAVQVRVREYTAWAREGQAKGSIIDGAQFVNRGMDTDGMEMVPWSGDEMHALSGWFLIAAADDAEAAKIARDCPHLNHGGSLRVRPLLTGREENPR